MSHSLDLFTPQIIQDVKSVIDASNKIVALTGAGISTESGIPDYRGPNGVWSKNPILKKTSNVHYYMNSFEVRQLAWQDRVESPIWKAEPNNAHFRLAELEKRGKLTAIVTQNIDRLHQKAGSQKVIELHGNVFEAVCCSCARRYPMPEVIQRVSPQNLDPRCLHKQGQEVCNGILRSSAIGFGEVLNKSDLESAYSYISNSDLLVVVGSSLVVQPAAKLVPFAKKTGVKVVIINASATCHDTLADYFIHAPIGKVMTEII